MWNYFFSEVRSIFNIKADGRIHGWTITQECGPSIVKYTLECSWIFHTRAGIRNLEKLIVCNCYLSDCLSGTFLRVNLLNVVLRPVSFLLYRIKCPPKLRAVNGDLFGHTGCSPKPATPCLLSRLTVTERCENTGRQFSEDISEIRLFRLYRHLVQEDVELRFFIQ